MLAAAQSASSSSNLQAWSVVAIEDAARKARLAVLAGNQAHIAAAPLFMVWLIDLHRLRQVASQRGEAADGLNYLESFLLGAVDAALAAQNAVVALESLGLGSVYIGAMRNQPEAVAAELGLPPHVVAVFGLAVGWPEPDSPVDVKPRLPPEAVLFREQYEFGETQRAAITAYDERFKTFQQEQALPDQGWSVQASRRVRDGKSLSGRDKLRQVLETLGFELR